MRVALGIKGFKFPSLHHRSPLTKRLVRNRWLYFMILPGVLYFIIFKYLPMWGIIIAFQDYSPFSGLLGSEWVGLKHFINFFGDPMFFILLKNTFILAIYNMFFFFPLPIIIALMLNEIHFTAFKRSVQTLIYIPHFFSWVVIVGISYIFFTTQDGVVNNIIVSMGGTEQNFLLSNEWFRTFIMAEVIWKETGWGTILFLAALSSVDPQQYEAARIDGANRWQQLMHVTLPAIKSVIVVLLILRLGNFLDMGFEQIFLMLNAMNRDVGEVFDTYVYMKGIQEGQFSFSTAVNLFKSVIGIIMVVGSNYLAKKAGEEGIY